MNVPRLRRLLPFLVLTLVCGALVAPLFFDQSLWLRDNLRYNYPEKLVLRARLLAGELPLWNPLAGLGRPLLALVQPAVLYPGTLLVLLPAPFGVDLYFAVHLLVAAAGLRAWLSATELPETEATIGGAIFGVSGYLVAMVAGNGAYAVGVAWIPWALWASARPGETTRSLAASGAKLGVMLALSLLAGDPQAVLIGIGLCTLQAAAAPSRRRALLVIAIGIGFAALLASPVLLAGWEAQSVARPSGVDVVEAGHFSLHPRRLIELVFPGVFGRPHSPASYISPLYDEGTGVAWEPWASGIYLGLLTPALAIYAVLRRCRERLDVVLAVGALLSLLLAFGHHTPIWPAVFRWVPGAGLFRYPEKYLLPFTICVCALAARALPTLVRLAPRAVPVAVGVAGTLSILAKVAGRDAGALAAWWVPRMSIAPKLAAEAVEMSALRQALVAMIIAALLWLVRRDRLTAPRLLLALGVVWIADVGIASSALMRFAPSEIYRAMPPLARELRGLAATTTAPWRVYRSMDAGELARGGTDPILARLTLLPSSGMEDGLVHSEPYTIFHTPYEDVLQLGLRGKSTLLLQVEAARYALIAGTKDAAHLRPGLTPVRDDPRVGALIVEIDRPSPRAYLVSEARSVANAIDATKHMLAADFVPGATAVIEDGEARSAHGECSILAYHPERVALRCTADAPTYAVLNDLWFPGWSATVDGAPTPILRANAAMRAIAIDAGRHEIVFSYRPRGLTPALIVAALTLGVALVLIRRGRIR